jgi:hypothetical protein
VDVQLQGYDPYRHSPDAALRRIMSEAKKALREVERQAAEDRKGADE